MRVWLADRHGCVLDNPPLAEEICEDPVLSALKLVAWSGDDSLLPRGGDRGFPHWAIWMQRNTRFSRDVTAFIAGIPAAASGLATRSHCRPAADLDRHHMSLSSVASLCGGVTVQCRSHPAHHRWLLHVSDKLCGGLRCCWLLGAG